MDKVVMLIWQFRDDPTVVTFMARFVAKVSMTMILAIGAILLDYSSSLHFPNIFSVCWVQDSL